MKKDTRHHAAKNRNKNHFSPKAEFIIGNKIMMRAAEPQFVPTAIGTRSASIISGMESQTTGPRVSPKSAMNTINPIITNTFPAVSDEPLMIKPTAIATNANTNTIVPNCRSVFLPNFDSR